MTRKSWFKIIAKDADDAPGDGHADILIYDDIGRNFWGEGIAAEDLVKELAALDVATLDVRINSNGGQVFEGLAIFNALQRHPAKVTTHIDGIAASIASIVALAGDTVRIAENAFVMVHNPHGIEMGDANAMRKMADILDTVGGSLVNIYAKKTGASEGAITAMMDDETWFNAAEALEAGMVDEVDEAMDIAAKFDFSKCQNVRPDVLERVADSPGATEQAKVDRQFDAAARRFKASIAQYKPPPAVKAEPAVDPPEEPDLVQLAAESEAVLARTLL